MIQKEFKLFVTDSLLLTEYNERMEVDDDLESQRPHNAVNILPSDGKYRRGPPAQFTGAGGYHLP